MAQWRVVKPLGTQPGGELRHHASERFARPDNSTRDQGIRCVAGAAGNFARNGRRNWGSALNVMAAGFVVRYWLQHAIYVFEADVHRVSPQPLLHHSGKLMMQRF